LIDDFVKHAIVFFATLCVVCLGVALGAPAEVLAPLAQGLGFALPAMLGAHGIARGVEAWKSAPSSEDK